MNEDNIQNRLRKHSKRKCYEKFIVQSRSTNQGVEAIEISIKIGYNLKFAHQKDYILAVICQQQMIK